MATPTTAFDKERAPAFYHPELDTLRFLAFLAVFCFHLLPGEAPVYVQLGVPQPISAVLASLVTGGAFGVDLFFALSSLLITELLLRELELRNNLDVKSFLIRRALRIWPLYFTFIGICCLLTFFSADGFRGKYVLPFFLFAGNWATVLWGFPASVASPLWSISVEEQFYVVWPFVVRHLSQRFFVFFCAILLGLSCFTRLILLQHGSSHTAIWCNTLARLDPIAVGAILAIILRKRLLPDWKYLRIFFGIAGLASWAAFAGFGTPFKEPQHFVAIMLGYPAVALGSGALLLAFWTNGITHQILRLKPILYLGRISYGLYVFHKLGTKIVQELLPWGGRSLLGLASIWVLSLGVTILFASISYALLELPFLRLKQHYTAVKSRSI